jgi:primase-polymerase (primpol)-like protein
MRKKPNAKFASKNAEREIVPFNNVPEELKDRQQWVNWKYEPNPNNPEKPKKVPINSKTGEKASVKKPDTWASFKDAVRSYKKGGVEGIGFVFTENDPYVGIDLDDCCSKKTGKIQPWAKKILNKIVSYSELSPSRTGVHIIAKGKLPGKGKKVGKIEIYDQGRYFTVTGEEF